MNVPARGPLKKTGSDLVLQTRGGTQGPVDVVVVVVEEPAMEVEGVGEPVELGVVVRVGAMPMVVGVEATVVLVVVVELEVVVVALLVDVVVGDGVSGDTQFAGGVVGPTWPGMRTVPAQPKLLKSALTVTEPPSENWYVVIDWMMKPWASTATSDTVPESPWLWSFAIAARIVASSSEVALGSFSSWPASAAT
jgi:hypothetical protein